MTDILPPAGWLNVRQLETNEFASGGANGNMNEQAKSLAARSELLKQYATLPYESKTGGYALGATVKLDNGDIVKSTIDGNVNDPNSDMTGWVKTNDASFIFDGNETQHEINTKTIRSLDSASELSSISVPSLGQTIYVKNDGHYGYLSTGWVKVYDTSSTSVLVDESSNETLDTLNEYFLKSIFELKEKIIDLENDAEDFSTLESRLIESLIKIDLPMVYNGSIAMSFDSVPSYESKTAVSGTVSGVVFADYRVELYVVTSKEYFWKTADIGTDGKWSFSNSNTGTKQVRLVRKSDNVWIHTLEIPTCVRSHRMTPDTDPATAAIMSDRTYTYDQAVVTCAMIAQAHPNLNHYVKGLLAVVGADGSVPFYVNRLSAFVPRNYYRSGNAAWVYYALAYYLKKYPSGTYAAEATTKLQLGLSWIDRFFVSNTNDPRYGLYRGGSGQFTDGGTVFDEAYQVYWCACEHNLDMWFVLNTAVGLGYTEYTARRDLVKNTIVNKLWSATENRLYTGINENGLDTTKYLDTSSWGGLFLLAAGETTKGRDSKAFLDTYKFATIEASGYTPYVEQNRTKGIWVEGSSGAALYERALGNITTNLNIIAKMRALLTPYGYRDSLIDPNDKTLDMWEQSCNTAWVLLAYNPNGFMNVD